MVDQDLKAQPVMHAHGHAHVYRVSVNPCAFLSPELFSFALRNEELEATVWGRECTLVLMRRRLKPANKNKQQTQPISQ